MSRQRLSQTLSVQDGQVLCEECSHAFSPAGQPWKRHAFLTQLPVRSLPGTGSGVQQQVVLRLFSCPACGALLDTETAMPEDPFLDDILKATK